MRNLKNLLLTVGLALTLSTPAGAVVSITLTQVGGTLQGWLGGRPGDTLVLEIGYSFDDGDAVTLVDPALVFSPTFASFDAAGSTETGLAAFSGGAIGLSPISTGDIALKPGGIADGWEKGTTLAGGASNPCVLGACSSLGTASFVLLSGEGGVISVGGVGQPFGTVIGDGTFEDITASSNLGTFFINRYVPEPTTASLLALGLLGLAAARRHRKS